MVKKLMIDKLGTLSWQQKRSKAKERIKEIAHSLISIAAKRYLIKGTVHKKEYFSWNKFCSGFQFEETEDQNSAISDILKIFPQVCPWIVLFVGMLVLVKQRLH